MKKQEMNKISDAENREFSEEDLKKWEENETNFDRGIIDDEDISEWERDFPKHQDDDPYVHQIAASLKEKIKAKLLSGKKVAHKGWEVSINDSDEIELYSPDGNGNSASLAYLDFVVGDFLRQASSLNKKSKKAQDFSTSKFQDAETEKLWDLSLDGGADEEASLGEGNGWWGLMRQEKAILHEDSQGFVSCDFFDSEEELAQAWQEIEDYTAGGDDDFDIQGSKKQSEILPEKTPKSVTFEKTKENLGEDSSTKEPFKKVKVNDSSYSSEDGSSDESLGEDSSGKPAFSTPEVNKELMPEIETGGLPDPSLGEDSTTKDVEWIKPKASLIDTFDKEASPSITYEELVRASPSANLIKNIFNPEKWAIDRMLENIEKEEPEEEDQEPEEEDQGPEEPEEGDYVIHAKGVSTAGGGGEFLGNPIEWEDISNLIVSDMQKNNVYPAVWTESDHGNFDNISLSFYTKEVNPRIKSSKKAQEEVESTDKEAVAPPGKENLVKKLKKDPEVDNPWALAWSIDNKEKCKESARLRESWDDGYSRDMEAESAEELHHLTRALSNEGDYDWARYRPRGVGDSANVPAVGEGPTKESSYKEAINDETLIAIYSALVENPEIAKEALANDEGWGDIGAARYFLEKFDQEFDEELLGITAMAMNKFRNKDKPDQDIFKEWASKKAIDQKAKEYWEKYWGEYGKKLTTDKEKKEKTAQAFDNAPADASPGGISPNPAPSPKAPVAPPQAPAKAPAKAPGAGDAALKGLGWLPDEIAAMSDQDKQNILKIKLKKPGSGSQVPAPQNTAPKTPAPKAPAVPGPAQPKEMPQEGIAPLPAHNPVASRKAQQAPTQEQQVPPQVDPNQARSPVPSPKTSPSSPTKLDPQGTSSEFVGENSGDGAIETKVFDIYKEVLQSDIQASSAEEVKIDKAKTLVQRILTETGMPITEAKILLGVGEKESFTKLFK